MPISAEDFERIVGRAEAASTRNPGLYRLKVAALGTLGYVFVWFLLLSVVGVALGVIYLTITSRLAYIGFKLVIPLVVLAGVLLKAMWVRFAPPAGIAIRAGDYPELQRPLERLRRSLRGPRIHAILLDSQFNARIMQLPRLGIFGWHRNYLVLGMPLLLALRPEELEAVLAHEYAHLSGADGKSGAWIYRIRSMWMRILHEVQRKQSALTGLVLGFLNWYAPWFNAYSFVLARANEYAADRAAATHVGARYIASALVRIELAGQALNGEYWDAVHRQANDSAEPPPAVISALRAWHFTVPGKSFQSRIGDLLQVGTDLSDTHPSLGDRLAAIGEEATVPEDRGPSAAETLFGTDLDDLLEALDDTWRSGAAPWFEARFNHVAEARERLETIASDPVLSEVDRLRARAGIVADIDGREASLPIFQEILSRAPEDPQARLVIAADRLSKDDLSAIADLEDLAENDLEFAPVVYNVLVQHYTDKGERTNASECFASLETAVRRRGEMLAERRSFPFEDVYEPADLPESIVMAIRDAVEAEDRWIDRAYLVRRRVTLSKAPVYVVGVAPHTETDMGGEPGFLSRIVADRLRDLTEEIYVISLTGPSSRLEGVFAEISGSRIF